MQIDRVGSAPVKDVPTTRFDMMGEAVAADPTPELRALRELGPIVWHETHRRWLVTTDREIRRLVADHRTYTVENTTVTDLFGADAFIAIDNTQRHNRLRNIWVEAFSRPGLDRLRPAATAIVDGLVVAAIDRLRSGEPVDIATTIMPPAAHHDHRPADGRAGPHAPGHCALDRCHGRRWLGLHE